MLTRDLFAVANLLYTLGGLVMFYLVYLYRLSMFLADLRKVYTSI